MSSGRIANRFLTVDVPRSAPKCDAQHPATARSWVWNGDHAFWTGRSPSCFDGRQGTGRVRIHKVSDFSAPMWRSFAVAMNCFSPGIRPKRPLRAHFRGDSASIPSISWPSSTCVGCCSDCCAKSPTAISGRCLSVLAFIRLSAQPLPVPENKPHMVTPEQHGVEPALVRLEADLAEETLRLRVPAAWCSTILCSSRMH